MDRTRLKNIARLVVPSAIGAALFLVPIPASGGQEILSGLVVSFLKGLFGEALVPALVMIVGASAVVTVWHHVHSISWIANHEKLNGVFSPSHFWTVVRVLGAVLMLVVYFSVGPEWLVGEDTGRNMLFTVIPTCAMWYLVGGVFLPFLTDYGFIDLFGAFFREYARPLFRIPGCAMIDCLSSWLGSTILVGFADQFATVILGTTIGSASLRFLIGCLSILQILYMTDIGSLILTSKVPFRFWQIFIVYLERILICIPVVRFCAFAFGIA